MIFYSCVLIQTLNRFNTIFLIITIIYKHNSNKSARKLIDDTIGNSETHQRGCITGTRFIDQSLPLAFNSALAGK
jgi:hypothetical protein